MEPTSNAARRRGTPAVPKRKRSESIKPSHEKRGGVPVLSRTADWFECLPAFARSAETGAFSAAGRLLSVTPSAVSKQIARLEDRLKVRLFDRTSRSLRLTPEGELLYERSIELLAQIEETEAVVTASASVPQGLLRVHCPPVFATSRLSNVSALYLQRYPHVRLEFLLGNEPLDFISSRIDVDIRRGHLADSALVARRITSSPWVICASPSYLTRCGSPASPAELRSHSCLNSSVRPESGRWPFVINDREQELHTRGAASSNSGEMLKQLAIAGAGIVRLLAFHVEDDLKEGRLIRLFPEQPEQSEAIYAVYLKRRNLSARVRSFVDLLVEELSV